MKNFIKLNCLVIFLLVVSCEKDKTDNPNESNPLQKEILTGFVQKGPFINGTTITVSELTSDLIQTGKTFNTQISDNKGSFELKQIELSSQFVELKADGFYFNENIGEKSFAQLTLYALSDLTDKSSLNVNILSHIEKGRIVYLVSQGSDFNEAKKQAQKEILDIFSIERPDMLESESLDISKDGEDNAILLAISVILQGFRTDAELSELLANISTDIKEDGVLNSSSLGTELINHAQLLNLPKIRENLLNRYNEMGVEATISNFEKYVQIFKDSTDFEFTGLINYPEFSVYGENILFADKSNFNTTTRYSLAADLPEGAELKIKLSGGLWFYEVAPNGPKNWTVSQYNENDQTQIFTSTLPGKESDMKIQFAIPYKFKGDSINNPGTIHNDTITIEYYENLSEFPTKTKTIIIEE
jgi:hypothetical protein